MNILCCETDDLTQEYMVKHASSHSITFEAMTAQELATESNAEVLLVFVNSRVDSEVLRKFPQLKLIITRSTGFDHINLAACVERGVIVCNVPTYGERTVAEYTFALLLTLSRKVYMSIKRVHEEGRFHTDGLKGFDLAGKTLGVIGTGRIGCHVIKIANGFEMNVIACDPYPKADLEKTCNMKYVTLEELLAQSDVITMHAPYMPATHYLLNRENMKVIKTGAVLINTARGALIETAGLVESLKEGRLSGVALDVLEEEGFVGEEWKLLSGKNPAGDKMEIVLADHQLMSFPNVIITPHNAFNTQEALERIVEVTVQNLEAFARGQIQNVVKG